MEIAHFISAGSTADFHTVVANTRTAATVAGIDHIAVVVVGITAVGIVVGITAVGIVVVACRMWLLVVH